MLTWVFVLNVPLVAVACILDSSTAAQGFGKSQSLSYILSEIFALLSDWYSYMTSFLF